MLRNVSKFTGAGLVLMVAAAANAQEKTYTAAEHDYRVVPVAEGLVHPWSMAWLPNGDMLVTEKPGRLRIVRDGKLLPEAVPGTPEVYYEGQGGLFEVRRGSVGAGGACPARHWSGWSRPASHSGRW